MKINFNVKSVKAWTTLGTAVITGVIGILTAFGIVVKQTDATTLYGSLTSVISILTALGILTASTDKPGDSNDPQK